MKNELLTNNEDPVWTDIQEISIPDPFIPTGICENCGERLATCKWAGEGGILTTIHNMASNWCELCALKAQLKYAKMQISRIPELEAAIALAEENNEH